jgi:hypothetical protein
MPLVRARDDAEERLVRLERLLQDLKRQTTELENRTRDLLLRIQPTIHEARTIRRSSRVERRRRARNG